MLALDGPFDRLDPVAQPSSFLESLGCSGLPHSPAQIFDELRGQIDRYHSRQKVRPGITGWAQINHHYDRSIDDVRRKVSLDLEYIDRQSFLEDLKIMALTVPVMVLRKGSQ